MEQELQNGNKLVSLPIPDGVTKFQIHVDGEILDANKERIEVQPSIFFPVLHITTRIDDKREFKIVPIQE